MPCETFTSTGASPAFDTVTQELGVTVAPSYSSEFYASTLEVCARVNYSGPLGFVKVQLAAGGSLRTRTLLDVTVDTKASLTGGGFEGCFSDDAGASFPSASSEFISGAAAVAAAARTAGPAAVARLGGDAAAGAAAAAAGRAGGGAPHAATALSRGARAAGARFGYALRGERARTAYRSTLALLSHSLKGFGARWG